jgi:hypothetical protein
MPEGSSDFIEPTTIVYPPRLFHTANLSWLYDGFVGACIRFELAEDARSEAKETFIPIFEALNWAASIELYLAEQLGRPLSDDLVHAIGYARNRVHHQWAAALESVQARFGPPERQGAPRSSGRTQRGVGASSTSCLPGAATEPESRPILPKLAGRDIRPTLERLRTILEQHVEGSPDTSS